MQQSGGCYDGTAQLESRGSSRVNKDLFAHKVPTFMILDFVILTCWVCVCMCVCVWGGGLLAQSF